MKRKPIRNRIVNVLSAFALIVGQVLMPTSAAFAQGNLNNAIDPYETPTSTGGSQPVWCMITGPSWTNQIGGDNTNRYALNVLPVGAGDGIYIDPTSGQVYAPNSSDPVLKGKLDAACAVQYTAIAPLQVAVCGPNNDTITAGAHMSITTDSGWVGNSRTITFTATSPYVFLVNSKYVSTATVTYTDNNEACPATPIYVPATPSTTDPCGLNNATWVVPADTASIDWQHMSGVLYAYTKTGYVFSDGTYVHNYGTAPDSGVLCGATDPTVTRTIVCGPNNDTVQVTGGSHYTSTTAWQGSNLVVTLTADANYAFSGGLTTYNVTFTDTNTPCPIAIPSAPYPTDPCGLSNATWMLPYDTATINWYLDGNNHLHAAVIGNYVFTDGSTDHDYGLAVDSGVLCAADKPYVTLQEVCGIKNDTASVTGGSHYTYSTEWVQNNLVVTVTAHDDYVFSDGKTQYIVTLTDKNTPCNRDVPAMPTYNDPCDDFDKVNSPIWTMTPVDTAQYTWELNEDNSYTVTATAGNIFDLPGGGVGLSYTYDLPINNPYKVCYDTIDAPQPPEPAYICGPISSATWTKPSDTETYTWKIIDGELWVYAASGYVFEDDEELVNKKNFGHASEYAYYEPCVIETPSYTAVAICGTENDTVTADEGDNYTVTVSEWVKGVKTITFTADEDFVFDNEETEFSVMYTDKGIACPVPSSPMFDDMSCDLNDTVSYTIPQSEYFLYTVQIGDGDETVVAAGNYNLARLNQKLTIRAYDMQTEELVQTWQNSYKIPVCNVGMGSQKPVVPAVAVQELPQTGAEDNVQYSLIGLALAVMTYAAVYFAQRKPETA